VEVTVKKLRKPAIVYILYFEPETLNHTLTDMKWFDFRLSELELNLVDVASVAKCWRQTFAGYCTLSEYFPSSLLQ